MVNTCGNPMDTDVHVCCLVAKSTMASPALRSFAVQYSCLLYNLIGNAECEDVYRDVWHTWWAFKFSVECLQNQNFVRWKYKNISLLTDRLLTCSSRNLWEWNWGYLPRLKSPSLKAVVSRDFLAEHYGAVLEDHGVIETPEKSQDFSLEVLKFMHGKYCWA